MKEKNIEIKAKLKGELDQIINNLEDLDFDFMQSSKDKIVMKKDEGFGFTKDEKRFYEFIFTKESIKLNYSILSDKEEKYRDLFMMQRLFIVFKTLEKNYEINHKKMMTFWIISMSKVFDISSQINEEKEYEISELLEEKNKLIEKNKKLIKELEKTNRLLLMSKDENTKLKKEIENLMALDDDLLKQDLIEWIKTHSGLIDIYEYSKIKKTTPKRIQDTLKELVNENYLEKEV